MPVKLLFLGPPRAWHTVGAQDTHEEMHDSEAPLYPVYQQLLSALEDKAQVSSIFFIPRLVASHTQEALSSLCCVSGCFSF